MDRAHEPVGRQQQLLGLQRKAGNHAVVAMLQRRPDVIRRDDRTASGEAVAPAGDAAAIADPGQFLRDAGAKWDDIRQRYRDGELGWTAGGDHEGTLNPGGLGMNAFERLPSPDDGGQGGAQQDRRASQPDPADAALESRPPWRPGTRSSRRT